MRFTLAGAVLGVLGYMVTVPALRAEQAQVDARWLIRDAIHRVEAQGAKADRVDRRGEETARLPHDFDVLHYEIELTPDLVAGSLSGTTCITIESEIAGLASVLLHLNTLTVAEARIGTTSLAFTHVGEELTITLDRAYALGETFELCIEYGGTPLHESFGGFWFYSDMAFNMGVGLATDPPSMGRYWFPCFDEPDDKATVTAHYTAPTGMMAVGNGLLVGSITSEDGRTVTWTWEEPHLASTYLVATAVADWRIIADPVDPTRIYHYVLPGDSVRAVTSFQNVSAMMAAFENRYGPYQYDKMSFVGVRKGDMEHSTCVAHLRSLINGNNFWDPLLAHELAHHWWGDWVTIADWRDIWLSEGFATFSEAVYEEYLGGMVAYHDYVNSNLMDYYLNSGETFPLYDPDYMWGATVYEKGGCVLHMLRHVVGEADFFQILDVWGASYGFANAVTTDFVAVAESVAGSDLSWFFDEWVYGEAYPIYEWSWEIQPDLDEHVLEIEVSQVQTIGPVFEMPVDFRITFAGGDSTITRVVDSNPWFVSIAGLDEEPLDVEFDPDRWILCEKTEIQVGVPAAGDPVPFALGPAAPNPFSPATSMRLTVNDGASPIRVGIYDGSGRLIRHVVDGIVDVGVRTLEWDGRDQQGRVLASGVYFMRAEQGERRITKRLILLR